jgi:teichoic acid transport system permease protein
MSITESHGVLRPFNNDRTAIEYLRDMWQRRDFAVALPVEQMRSTHQDTLLGNVWHLGNPALTVGVYYIVFAGLLGADRGVPNYLLWLTIGVFAYRFTQGSVQSGAGSIHANQGLMRSFRFPRAILPLSAVVSDLLTFAFQLAVLGTVALVTGAGVSTRWLVLPAVVALHASLNLGVAFIAARLSDAFRDVQQLIPFVFRLLQYLSGVMFPLDRFLQGSGGKHAWVHGIIVYNPIVRILELYRWVFLGTPVDLTELVRSTLIIVALLVFGFRYFRAVEYRYGR